jgi:putative transcriptional regulator
MESMLYTVGVTYTFHFVEDDSQMNHTESRHPVGNQVQHQRKARQLTQEALGQQVGLTRQSINAIERGRFVPSVQTALLLARALDMRVDDLFWLDDASHTTHEGATE